MRQASNSQFIWLPNGGDALTAMVAAIHAAERSVRLEMYIFDSSPIADQFRDALTAAAERGLSVRVMIDAFGSMFLSDDYWNGFRAAGGEFHWFNPNRTHRFGFRDHRKLLVCDESIAFIGGFNIGAVYLGDGVGTGWRDLGMRIEGSLSARLAETFESMFASSHMRHKTFARFRKSAFHRRIPFPGGELFLAGPGRNNPLKSALRADLHKARKVSIACAYFLPPRRIWLALARLARRGATVRLVLPGKSDVLVTQLAAQTLYRRLLRAGVEIYEYQPQILHAKLFIVDDVAFVGSSNLDFRSLNINYELMLRLPNASLAAEGREIFDDMVKQSRRVELREWQKSRTWLDQIKGWMARWLVTRLDPFVARQSS